MSAVVSRERAKMAGVTGAVGLLVVALAVVMMIVAAPRPHPQATSRTDALTAAVCASQYASSSASTMAPACWAGPPAVSAWAEAYTPSMTSES